MIIQSLYEYYKSNDKLSKFGFSMEDISFNVEIIKEGTIKKIFDLRITDTKVKKSLVPYNGIHTSNVKSNFTWDKSTYSLGVPTTDKKSTKHHTAFKKLHKELLCNIKDKNIKSFLLFLENWNPSDFDKICKESNIDPNDMFNKNIVFSFSTTNLHELEKIENVWLTHLKSSTKNTQTCMITGKKENIVIVHPKIKGIIGQKTGSIVSFNSKSYESYGKKQNYNAPMSEEVVHAYVTALNYLLKENKIVIDKMSVVFWSNDTNAEYAMEELFKQEPTKQLISDKNIQSEIEMIKQGGKIENINESLQKQHDTRCYILGMSPNNARISIDFWYVNTLGDICEKSRQHYEDIKIEPECDLELTFNKILEQTAVLKKQKNIPSNLAVQLLRSVLEGTYYPRLLLTSTIQQMKIKNKNYSPNDDYVKAAIIKACLIRNMRFSKNINLKDTTLTSLDKDEANTGYRLGRMFAVLEKIQKDALGDGINTTIRDRFYGSASSTPSVVFPMLIRSSKHHLSKLFKDESKKGYAINHEKILSEIMTMFSSAFPNILNIEDQGRFAIGYYHQKSEYYKKRSEN